MRKPVVGGLDPRLLAAANALKSAHGPKSTPSRPQLSDRRRLKIDYGRPGEGKKKWARRRTVEVRRRGYDITKRVQPEPFSISRVILDLDAEDSPYVRHFGFRPNAYGRLVPYSDRKKQKDVWNHDPKLDALVERMDDFKHEIRASEEKWHAPLELFDPRRISKRDIMEVVLLGIGDEPNGKSLDANRGTIGAGAKEPEPLRHFLQASGVPDRVLSDEVKTLDFVAAWRKAHPVPVLDRHNLPPSPVQGHVPWPGLHSFKRALAAQLGNGIEETSQDEGNQVCDHFWGNLDGNSSLSPWSTQVIVDGLRTEDPVEALALLHNTALRLASNRLGNCHFPDTITKYAIELAIQTDNFSTIPTFLYRNLPEINKFTVETWLEKNQTSETTAKQRLGFLGLLVKKIAGSRDMEHNSYKVSTRGGLRSNEGDYDAYGPYVQALGSIGAIRTLWHEWHGARSPSSRSTPAYYAEDELSAEVGEDERFREECIRALNLADIKVATHKLGKLLITEVSKA
ncbi:hypothetical protein DL546_001942 [Coniochaeta pulveracea]|uniref:Uncharacterized protein n=1 Tax=Coniochaeta pulveracea TaxID=177199 RepID=A0A420XXC3_9PEZI|nr:hypothetical protein DL546_001942 [Coniochaeta pulveracea]